jgi:hypothetical protein
LRRFLSSQRYKRLLAQVLGLLLVAAGCLMGVMYGQKHTLICERFGPASIACRQELSWLGFVPLGQGQTISLLLAAEIETTCHTDTETLVYECIDDTLRLITSDGAIALPSSYFNVATVKEAAARLNQFIQESEDEQLVIESINPIMAVLGLSLVSPAFIILGILTLLFAWR